MAGVAHDCGVGVIGKHSVEMELGAGGRTTTSRGDLLYLVHRDMEKRCGLQAGSPPSQGCEAPGFLIEQQLRYDSSQPHRLRWSSTFLGWHVKGPGWSLEWRSPDGIGWNTFSVEVVSGGCGGPSTCCGIVQ